MRERFEVNNSNQRFAKEVSAWAGLSQFSEIPAIFAQDATPESFTAFQAAIAKHGLEMGDFMALQQRHPTEVRAAERLIAAFFEISRPAEKEKCMDDLADLLRPGGAR